MRWSSLLLAIWLWPAVAAADEADSVYTRFDLEKDCRLVEQDAEQTYAIWSCPGYEGTEVIQAVSDDRSFVGFGPDGVQRCTFRRTFTPFNTALSPIEWRLRNGLPFAVIERWRVVTDDEGNSNTWLVVSALHDDDTCPVHYVAGSYPNANEEARRAADEIAAGFNCKTDRPGYSSTIGAPPIDLEPCGTPSQQ